MINETQQNRCAFYWDKGVIEMIDNLSIFISLASFVIAVISIVYSIKAFKFSQKIRDYDNRPLLQYSNSFGSYFQLEMRIPNINLELINSGSTAIIIRIEDTIGNKISCSQINNSINKNDLVKITINTNQRIKHEDLKYNVNIYLKNIDEKIYLQKICGNGIFPKISPAIKIKSFK